MERLLAVETPERAPELAGRLATMWEAAGDMPRACSARSSSRTARAPDDTAIHDRLEKWYRDRELWAELAELMTHDAERAARRRARSSGCARPRRVYSGFLGQPLKAAEVLRKARQRAPHVAELVTDHAAALAAAGELDAAQRAIGEALATVHGHGPHRAAAAARELPPAARRRRVARSPTSTEAYELDKERVAETLVNGLERLRVRAERDGDLPTERTATLQLAKLLVDHGELERGRALPGRAGSSAIRATPSRCTSCAISTSRSSTGTASPPRATRLAYVTEGEPQVDAALRAATASTQAGRPAEAVPVLELVHQASPASR